MGTANRKKLIKKDSHRDHRAHGGKILGALGVLTRWQKIYFIYKNKMEESQQIEFKKSLAERKELENLNNEIHEFIYMYMPTLCQLYANYHKCLVRVIEYYVLD